MATAVSKDVALKQDRPRKWNLRSRARKWWKWLANRRKRGLVGSVIQIGLLAAVLLFFSGYVRGQWPDRLAAGAVGWLQDTAVQWLGHGWVDPTIAHGVVMFTTYCWFVVLLLALASVIRNVPAYIGFLILSELNRRQGRSICALEVLLAISMPIAVTMALVSHEVLSLLACLHFILCYAYVRLSNHPSRVDNILNWYVRVRTSMDSGSDGDDAATDDDGGDDADDDV